MSTIKDNESGKNYVYKYSKNSAASPHKKDWVIKYTEKGGSTEGNYVWRNMEPGRSKIRNVGADRINGTADDTLEHLLFDYGGRTVNYCVTDSTETKILGASTQKYEATSGTSKKNNKVNSTASVGVPAVNLLSNGGMESGTNNWAIVNGGLSVNSTTRKRTGEKCFVASGCANSWAYQALTLEEKKTYTFSAYVDTSNVSGFDPNEGINLKIMNADRTSLLAMSDVFKTTTSKEADGGWQRISVTCKIDTKASYVVIISFVGISGTAYADDFQLEEADAPGNVNLVTNGSFEQSGGWGFSEYVNGGTVTNEKISGKNSFKITGSPDNREFAYQDIPINLPATETFVLSGWAMGDSVPTKGDYKPGFMLYAILTYTDGTQEHHLLPFNSDVTGWQFASMPIVPKRTGQNDYVSSIRVHCHYNYNANTVYFDNISLVREVAQTYKYDSNGNVVKVNGTNSRANATSTTTDDFTYSGANLIKEVTVGNGIFNYEYDTNNNLKKVTNDILKMDISYDSSGNTTQSTLSNTDGGKKIISEATYTNDRNALSSIVDSNNLVKNYHYQNTANMMRGEHSMVKDGNGVEIYHNYNYKNGRHELSYMPGLISVDYHYSSGRLETIGRGGYVTGNATKNYQYYGFDHNDPFGNLIGVWVYGSGGSGTCLASYNYGPNNGNLIRATFGNLPTSQYVDYKYDTLDRLKMSRYNDGTEYSIPILEMGCFTA